MGLTDFNPFIKTKGTVARPRPLTDFSGHRLAIDAHNWSYTRLSIAHKQTVGQTNVILEEPDRNMTIGLWLSCTLDFICTLLQYHITPVFVFDGEHPREKMVTKQKRLEKKVQARQEAQTLKEQLKTFDQLMLRPEHVKKLRDLLSKDTRVARQEIELLMSILRGLGIPCLQCTTDGEKLCSMLCREGRVAAVISADTDNYALGCPLVLQLTFDEPLRVREDDPRSQYGLQIHQISGTETQDILAVLEMDGPTFLDWCICIGCDFNTRMPKIGVKRAYDLLKKWGRLEMLPGKYDPTCLRYVRCRELFQYIPSHQLVVGSMHLDMGRMQAGEVRTLLEIYKLTRYIEIIYHYSRMIPTPPQICQSVPLVKPILRIIN